MKRTLEEHIKFCLSLEDKGPIHFERFIHGGVIPTLQKFRDAKLLKKVHNEIVKGEEGCLYSGELTNLNDPHGYGILIPFG